MNIFSMKNRRILAPAAAAMGLLALSACGSSEDAPSNTAATENVTVPPDEVAAEMHNQMSRDDANRAAASGGMMDDQMGGSMGGGAMGNGSMGGMMDDNMPMGGGNMASGAAKGDGMNMGGANKGKSKSDNSMAMPMEDEM